MNVCLLAVKQLQATRLLRGEGFRRAGAAIAASPVHSKAKCTIRQQ
jgi:hypothetical protein